MIAPRPWKMQFAGFSMVPGAQDWFDVIDAEGNRVAAMVRQTDASAIVAAVNMTFHPSTKADKP